MVLKVKLGTSQVCVLRRSHGRVGKRNCGEGGARGARRGSNSIQPGPALGTALRSTVGWGTICRIRAWFSPQAVAYHTLVLSLDNY